MPNEFSANATVAKARAIYGKRLNYEDYRELLHRNSVNEVAEYLKRNTHYHDVLSSIDTNTVHRGFLEEILRRDAFRTYINLCKFQQLDKISFYNYRIVQNEIEQIITCILHINSKKSEEYITAIPSYLIDYSSFDMMALARVKKFNDVLEVIKNTPYYDIVKQYKPDENGLYNCSKIEMALRTYYLTWLVNTIDKDFGGKTKTQLNTLVSNHADIINIINSYRLKSFFKVSASEIEEDMLPLYGRLSKNKQYEIFNSKDIEEYISRLKKTYYGRQIEMIDSTFEKSMLEHSMHALLARYAKITLRASQTAPVSLYTIVFLFDIEIENIVNIIEGIRYHVPTDYIQKLLII